MKFTRETGQDQNSMEITQSAKRSWQGTLSFLQLDGVKTDTVFINVF